jgi:trypsin
LSCLIFYSSRRSGTSEGKPLSTAHVGRWNTLKYGSNDEYDSIRIKKEYIHPRYNEDDNLTYDLMLVQLSKNSIYEPVRLNERFSIPNANSLLTAIGFGLTVVGDDLSSSSVLQQVDLNYIPNTVCEKSNDGNDSYEGLINNAMICAGAPGKDGCLGDSGGPLISRKDNSNAKDDVIVGVTSWGYSCADPNFPGVWASVFDQIDWLTGMICQISTSPPRQFYDCPQKGIDGDVPVVVEITLDDYPMESSWQVTCNNGLVYGEAVIGKYGFKKNEVLQEVVYLPSGSTCVFTIKDKYGDGLCCDTAGSYKVFLSNKPSSTLVSGGGNFGSEKSDSFSIPTDAYDDDGDGEVVIAKGQVPLTVAIQLDEYPKEIGWRVDRVGIALETVYSVPQGTYRTPNELVVENLALEKRQIYTFHVTDSEGDGMNRGYGTFIVCVIKLVFI